MSSQADTRQSDIRGRLLTRYEHDDLLERIDTGLTALGEDPAKPSPESLSPAGELHIRGAAATAGLIDRIAVGPDHRGLDIGSGPGGPAGPLAAATGVKSRAPISRRSIARLRPS